MLECVLAVIGNSRMQIPPPPVAPEAWIIQKFTRGRRGRLLGCTDVPARQKVPFILGGYRPAPKGPWDLLQTVFSLHNETGNIWTHLVGFLYYVWLTLDLAAMIVSHESHLEQAQGLWVLLLVVASGYCLCCSFCFHLCSCSPLTRECTYKLDLTGIVVLIAVSYFTGIALGYRCYPELRLFYLAYAALVSAALAVPVVKPDLVQDIPRHFIVCVVLGVVPAVHFIAVARQQEIFLVLPHLLKMFGYYGIGALFYVKRWPESKWPGRFDFLGHSHQFWHIFVLLASASWVEGCSAMLYQQGSCVLQAESAGSSHGPDGVSVAHVGAPLYP